MGLALRLGLRQHGACLEKIACYHLESDPVLDSRQSVSKVADISSTQLELRDNILLPVEKYESSRLSAVYGKRLIVSLKGLYLIIDSSGQNQLLMLKTSFSQSRIDYQHQQLCFRFKITCSESIVSCY